METVGARSRRFRLQVDTQCPCKGCVEKVDKAMASIGSFTGVEKSERDVDTGRVTVEGKVNPEELCEWLKSKTRKDVNIVCTDLSVENPKQTIILIWGSSSETGNTTRPCPSEVESYHKDLQLIEDKIRDLEKDKHRLLKIKNQKEKLDADNCKLDQVINDTKKVVLDSALNQFEAYKKLDSLHHARHV